jgi:hypothetical protein
MGNRGNKLAQRRRQKARQRNLIQPALFRPERFEIERRTDAYVMATERQHRVNAVVAVGLLGTCGAGLVVAVLSALGVL